MGTPLAAVGAGVQAVTGLAQLFGGLFTKKPKRPEYEIQSEYQNNVDLARGIKNMGGMDKASYTSAVQNIGRTQSTGIGQSQDRRSGMAMIGNLVQRSNDALLNLDSMNARIGQQNFLQGSRMEMGANAQLGSEKKAKFQWDKLQPYLDKVNQRNALIGAGMQNIVGAGQSLAMFGAGKDLNIGGKKQVDPMAAQNAALAYDAVQPGYRSRKQVAATGAFDTDDSMFEYDSPTRHY